MATEKKAPKILVVDDEEDILKIVVFRLQTAGYQTVTAADGGSALFCVKEERPDLILLDIRMPIMSGFDVCKQLKSDDEFKNIPIIFLTASNAATVAAKTKQFGADDYLVKPFDPKVLLEKVKKFTK
ncbi:MAG: response regulator [Candidatus Omnitrophota bacterium]